MTMTLPATHSGSVRRAARRDRQGPRELERVAHWTALVQIVKLNFARSLDGVASTRLQP